MVRYAAAAVTLWFSLPWAQAASVRIVVIGDSTVSEYPQDKPERGWGHFLQAYFDSGVEVINLAVPGRSTKTFLSEGRWAAALEKKPDLVLIQFGHNDSHDPKNPESTDANTGYRENLRKYVSDALAIGATPILITPMQRRTKEDTLAPYAEAMQRVAAETGAALIDLHAMSGDLYQTLGEEATTALANLPTDKTHFNQKGAEAMAALVMKTLPALDARLRAHLVH